MAEHIQAMWLDGRIMLPMRHVLMLWLHDVCYGELRNQTENNEL